MRSLVIGGQQPYWWPDSPLTRAVTKALDAAQSEGMEAFTEALEDFWGTRFPEPRRTRALDNDPAALRAAWRTALSGGPISGDLRRGGSGASSSSGATDADFLDQARRAASEMPSAEFIALDELDHYGAHTSPGNVLLEVILRAMRDQ